MKKLGLMLVTLALVATPHATAEAQFDRPIVRLEGVDPVIADWGRAVTNAGISFVLVHLNDVTTEAIFDAPLKYQLRAQARASSMFYLQGAADTDVDLNGDFRIIQLGDYSQMRTIDIENFVPGDSLSAGDPIRGIITGDKLFNIREPLHIEYGGQRISFEFPSDVLAQLLAPAP